MIGSIDQRGTIRLQQREMRILKQTERQEHEECRAVSSYQSSHNFEFGDDDQHYNEHDIDESSTEFSNDEADIVDIIELPEQNRRLLQYLAELCDRYGISDRAGASIANSVLRERTSRKQSL